MVGIEAAGFLAWIRLVDLWVVGRRGVEWRVVDGRPIGRQLMDRR
jgi:hypothetical protein